MALKDDVQLGFDKVVDLIKINKTGIGVLADLKTTIKTNLVGALNALYDIVAANATNTNTVLTVVGTNATALAARVTTLESAGGTADFVTAITTRYNS